MKTEYIDRIDGRDPQKLLDAIEATPDAFTQGRRNNDMVNWFIAQRILARENGTSSPDYGGNLVQAFDGLLSSLSPMQQADIRSWSTPWRSKLETLWRKYRHNTTAGLCYLWLPMEYDDLSDPNQLTIAGVL